MEKKILIAIDGSIYSTQELEYVAHLFADQNEIHFHLITCITASESAFPLATDGRDSLLPVPPEAERKKEAAQNCLLNAIDKLVHLQIAPERISSSVEISGYNIAATIQGQADTLLMDSILIGRRGLGYLGEMFLGSVSATLLKKCHATPLWIINGEVRNRNFLVPVDGSLPSLLAVDHLAYMLEGRQDVSIFLFHCHHILGRKIEANPAAFYHLWEKDWCDLYLGDSDHLFRGPTQLLIEAGIPESKIITLPEAPDLEPAHAIIRQAEKRHCGTIVIGRREDESTKGVLGGVSDRTLKHAEDIAVWVVG